MKLMLGNKASYRASRENDLQIMQATLKGGVTSGRDLVKDTSRDLGGSKCYLIHHAFYPFLVCVCRFLKAGVWESY